ncbi:unnamed protein product [Spirodela intermedia]|uniref:Uncharacterized protein n=1 Tax=Spirodela intermedia TaxID=51605 RepID=A0A7I8JIA9_SPIIN|nr:unnamed protein product [Spirodela intermedia]CAA6669152.1 unnamed protein product [Spirodela intermedia]
MEEAAAAAAGECRRRKALTAKKKRPGVNLLRLAVFMVRLRSPPGAAPSPAGGAASPRGKGLWKTLVAVVRLLHPVGDRGGAMLLPTGTSSVPPTPPSPSASEDSQSGWTSRYPSAADLRELADSESDEEADGGGGGGAPHSIDLRAEEFIARFYEQMRLQQLDSLNADPVEPYCRSSAGTHS